MTGTLAHRTLAVLLACLVSGACSTDSPGRTSVRSRGPGGGDDSAAGTIDIGGAAYTPGPLEVSGSIAGRVTLAGLPRVDSVRVAVDTAVCGTWAPGVVSAKDSGLSNTVVWIADMTRGKSLPVERRIDLSSEDCRLDPRVQAAVVGTTVNVTNADRLLHKLVYMPIGTTDTLTRMPFFNDGQVVPSERLTRTSAIVEVRCTIHPWTHAYIAVFDHPYFAVTGADGKFTIDSLPPGRYKLMLWHEGMERPAEQQVQVTAGGTAAAGLAVTIPAA